MKKLNNKGFSLVELIIVIAIMAILVGVMAPALMKYIEKSRYSADAQIADSAYSALKYAMADENCYKEVSAIVASAGANVTTTLDIILAGTPINSISIPNLQAEVVDTFGSEYGFGSKAFNGEAINVVLLQSGEFEVTVTSQEAKYDDIKLPKPMVTGP